MKKYILYIAFLLSVNIIAQEINLKGQVFEMDTNTPLAGATIQLMDSEVGVISDFDGNFQISLNMSPYLFFSP